MRLNDSSLTLHLEQGAGSSAQVVLTNPSSIGVPWTATVQSNRPWVTVTPSGSVVNGGPAAINIFVSAAGLAPTSINTATITVKLNQ